LFGAGSKFWEATAGGAQTVFAGGALLHQKRAAEANLDAAAAQYRSTVLHAFQDVADTLEALKFDADALRLQRISQQAAEKSLAITQDSLKIGATSYLSVLSAQQALLQANLALAQARASRFGDTVALFQALGGGLTGADEHTAQTGASEQRSTVSP
jgi:outer membrane protein TolC